HTRLVSDWSSDVCSSDLNQTLDATFTGLGRIGHEAALQQVGRAADGTPLHIRNDGPGFDGMDVPAFRTFPGANGINVPAGSNQRSEERRVGKECRARRWP